MTTDSHVEYEMSISHKTFLRTLPDVLGNVPFNVEGQVIEARWPDRSLKIRLSPEGERDLGQLELPVTIVTLDFQSFSEEQKSQFLERFHEHYMRGAGGP
jgi:hypothetical protein